MRDHNTNPEDTGTVQDYSAAAANMEKVPSDQYVSVEDTTLMRMLKLTDPAKKN